MEIDNKPHYFGINDKGYGCIFDTMEELEAAGYTFCKEVYKQRIVTMSNSEMDKIPKLTAKVPRFDIKVNPVTIVKP